MLSVFFFFFFCCTETPLIGSLASTVVGCTSWQNVHDLLCCMVNNRALRTLGLLIDSFRLFQWWFYVSSAHAFCGSGMHFWSREFFVWSQFRFLSSEMHDILFPSHHVASPISHFAVIELLDSEKQIKVSVLHKVFINISHPRACH